MLAIKTIAQKLKVSVGYSDHTIGYVASIAAIVLGANVIEKHFTISRNLHGPDHKSSLEPNELKFFIESIRDLNKSFGNGKKITSKSEKKNKIFVRRSIVAIKKIKKGETFNLKNIGVKRPGSGISPMNFFKLIGKRSKKNYKLDEMIK